MFPQNNPPPAERIAVIIPMYRVASYIQDVIRGIPDWVHLIVAVDDASPDDSAGLARQVNDPRLVIVCHDQNQGVGGAMLTGMACALDLGATVLVKMDGDHQMPPEHLPAAVQPILEGGADFVKGNRFADMQALRSMPFLRRIGNLGLSFLIKMASGYWNVFDPANGYFAIDADVFRSLDRTRIHRRYFFESSLLVELNMQRAVIQEFSMPARYAGEISSLSIGRALLEFPWYLFKSFLHRLWLQYFVLDFSVGSLFLLAGSLLCLFGASWGAFAWDRSIRTGVVATTGTVMLAVLPLILGFQLLLQSIVSDVQNVPRAVRSRHAAARIRQINGLAAAPNDPPAPYPSGSAKQSRPEKG